MSRLQQLKQAALKASQNGWYAIHLMPAAYSVPAGDLRSYNELDKGAPVVFVDDENPDSGSDAVFLSCISPRMVLELIERCERQEEELHRLRRPPGLLARLWKAITGK